MVHIVNEQEQEMLTSNALMGLIRQFEDSEIRYYGRGVTYLV